MTIKTGNMAQNLKAIFFGQKVAKPRLRDMVSDMSTMLAQSLRLPEALEDRVGAIETLLQAIETSIGEMEGKLEDCDIITRRRDQQQLAAFKILLYVQDKSSLIEQHLMDADAKLMRDEQTTLIRLAETRSRTLEAQLADALKLLKTTEERSRTLETQLGDALGLLKTIEERSRTLQYQGGQTIQENAYHTELLQTWYVESMQSVLVLDIWPNVRAAAHIILATDHPVALTSNDHIEPDSTTEGLVRPTRFVRHCIDIMGPEITCLDLGAGAGGLLFEYTMNGLVAIGLDGSDFCRRNKIGYWPLLPNNLHTCDLAYPFQFWIEPSHAECRFDLITMWEVLEHIKEDDLPQLFRNIALHLMPSGYFLGSVSMVEYVDGKGIPYHVTLKPKSWWLHKFAESGLEMLEKHSFDERLFYRGNGPRFQDFHNYSSRPADGFHFVARHSLRKHSIATNQMTLASRNVFDGRRNIEGT